MDEMMEYVNYVLDTALRPYASTVSAGNCSGATTWPRESAKTSAATKPRRRQ
jgi:hypothetical protein